MTDIGARTAEWVCPVCGAVFPLGIVSESTRRRRWPRRTVEVRVWIDGVGDLVAHAKGHTT